MRIGRTRFLSLAIASTLVLAAIGFFAIRMSFNESREPQGAIPSSPQENARSESSTMRPSPITDLGQPAFVEWNILPMPPTPKDKILNVLEETVDVDWNWIPIAEAAAQLLEPIALDYRGFVSLRSVLPRILHPLYLDYIVLEDG